MNGMFEKIFLFLLLDEVQHKSGCVIECHPVGHRVDLLRNRCQRGLILIKEAFHLAVGSVASGLFDETQSYLNL